MFLLRSFLVSTALLVTASVSSIAHAAEPHSWCTTGAPLIRRGASDVDTNQLIENVCSKSGFESCCAPSGRWGLTCVQAAAQSAHDTIPSLKDYCGRFAWAENSVLGTQQYVPRDFNLVATSGSASGMRDIDGPVAASGTVAISYFNLNLKKREGTAVVAGARLGLSNGTVNGAAHYGTGFTSGNVTFVDATRPTAASRPIDFTAVANSLNGMTQALLRYDSIVAVKNASSITFTGTDPELNVFSVASSQLTGTTSYTFNIPAGSAVIVNVTGTTAAFANAGFTGPIEASKLLWNFPDATSLTMNSMAFPGSILAPRAAANLQNGNIRGTVVVASANPANVELYMAPFQMPSCSGGLCLDPTWSTSGDTVLDDRGRAARIAAEAGFLEIAGGDYVAESATRTSPKHRMWYAFQPAKSSPKTKPIAVIFNGGPGSGTSPLLFSFNTNNYTLDPQLAGGAKIVANPNSWTQFANLLYIDAPATGFSYPLANPDGTEPDIGTDMDHDASIVMQTVLRFLARHPALQSNRVIVVGESYGGARATLMLDFLYRYASLTDPAAAYRDLQLSNELSDYFSTVLGTTTPTAAQIATKFGHQILIEPSLVGKEQGTHTSSFPTANCRLATPPMTQCWVWDTTHDATCDVYNCDKEPGWSDALIATAAKNLTDVSILALALGVNPRTIEWMKASSRTNAYGRDNGTIVPSTTMNSTFGTLGERDSYLMVSNKAARSNYGADGPSPARTWASPGAGALCGAAFARNVLNGVATFITVTKYDAAIWTPSIAYALDDLSSTAPELMSLIDAASYDGTWKTAVPARPGAIGIFYSDPAGATRSITTPTVYNAGHTVPMRAPAEMFTDVTLWYAASPH